MAEGLLRHLAKDCFEAYSAGIEPTDEIHPCAVEAMREPGIDIADALLVGRPLARHYAVLALMPTVIRSEHQVGVVERYVALELVDHRLHEVV